MAGIQWKGGKCHGAGEAKAMMRHACADERVRHGHSNTDIDTARTKDNTDLFGLSYTDMCEEYDARLEVLRQATEMASGRALRKDAVTLLDAIIPVPRGLADAPVETQDAWYRDVMREINRHYGANVVLDMKVHRDEIHEYVDPDTGRKIMSRVHAHCFCFPEVGSRLNAKTFTSRANITALNREVDAMTQERYGCPYITGDKVADRRWQTVEQLKVASDAKELEGRAVAAEMRAARSEIISALRVIAASKYAAEVKSKIQEQEARARTAADEATEAVQKAAEATKDLEATKRAKTNLQVEINGLQARREDLASDVDDLTSKMAQLEQDTQGAEKYLGEVLHGIEAVQGEQYVTPDDGVYHDGYARVMRNLEEAKEQLKSTKTEVAQAKRDRAELADNVHKLSNEATRLGGPAQDGSGGIVGGLKAQETQLKKSGAGAVLDALRYLVGKIIDLVEMLRERGRDDPDLYDQAFDIAWETDEHPVTGPEWRKQRQERGLDGFPFREEQVHEEQRHFEHKRSEWER